MVFMDGVLSVVSERVVGKSNDSGGVFRGCSESRYNLAGKFVELRSGRGGLKLCHITLSSHYWENARILLTCNRPLWDFYTDQVENCKSPQDGIRYAGRMCTGWNVDNQLKKLVRILTCDDQEALASFRKVGQWSNDEQRMANKIFQYVQIGGESGNFIVAAQYTSFEVCDFVG